MKDNIFTYQNQRRELLDTFYSLLMKGKPVSYSDVLQEYDEVTFSENPKISRNPFYPTLKHVVSELVQTLRNNDYYIIESKVKQTTLYQYIGGDKDPLKNIRFRALIDERCHVIEDCIDKKQPIRFTYWPFNKGKMNIILHPHILYRYNGRAFAIGVSKMEGYSPFRCQTIALDRIYGDIIHARSSIEYLPANENEYSYLSQIVGVRKDMNSKLTTIRLRALDKYTFGRLTTKPIHDSQKTVVFPNYREGRSYGEVELTVYPNLELQGQILSYGATLVVVSPDDYKEVIRQEINKTLELYNNQ